MTLIVAVIIGLIFLVTKYLILDKLSKIFIYLFIAWWGVWLILSTLDVYGLFTVDNSTYLLILLAIFMFVTGFVVGLSQKSIHFTEVGQIHTINIHQNKVYKVILIAVFLLVGYYFIRYQILSRQIPTNQLRIIRFSVGALFTSTEQLLFFNFFIEPFIFVLYAVIAYMIIYNKMKNIVFALSALTLFMYAGIGSGRLPIIYMLMSLVFMFLISKINPAVRTIEEQLSSEKIKKLLKSSIYVLIAVFPLLLIYASWLTAFRLGQTSFSFETISLGFNELMKQFIVYFTGPFRALDYGLKNYVSEIPLLYGQATLAGINELLHATLHVLGVEIRNINYLLGDYLQNRSILVADGIFFNYAYTFIMIFYFDLGIIGVVLFSFIFGFFARKTIFLFNKKPSIPSLVLLVFYFLAVIFSVFSWMFQSPSAILLLISMSILQKVIIDSNGKSQGGEA